jgi:hypothetical protein
VGPKYLVNKQRNANQNKEVGGVTA